MARINPDSPVPLYHQIAEAIREHIRSGKISPGDVLEPLRKAAESWGVNLHTVRHAYAALAREGLVEQARGRAGTRVMGSPSRDLVDLPRFLDRVCREASDRFGLPPVELAAALVDREHEVPTGRPAVWVVECSEWQCESHAREIAARWNVDARPWSLVRGDEPPDGVVVSTYFHYNDIRRQWPRRLEQVRFVAIRPDPSLGEKLAAHSRVLVCERDLSTAEAVVADVIALLGDEPLVVEALVRREPSRALTARRGGAPVLFSPRTWAELKPEEQAHPHALELRYVMATEELEALGARHGWERAAGAAA